MRTYPGLARLVLLLIGGVGCLCAGGNGGLEFRGVVQEDAVWLVNIHDSATNISRWIPVGGEAGGVAVRSYDDAAVQVVVAERGNSVVLPLKRYFISVNGPTAPLRLLGPGEQVPAAENPAMPDYLRELPPDARKILSDVRRRPAIRWPAPAGTTQPKPQ